MTEHTCAVDDGAEGPVAGPLSVRRLQLGLYIMRSLLGLAEGVGVQPLIRRWQTSREAEEVGVEVIILQVQASSDGISGEAYTGRRTVRVCRGCCDDDCNGTLLQRTAATLCNVCLLEGDQRGIGGVIKVELSSPVAELGLLGDGQVGVGEHTPVLCDGEIADAGPHLSVQLVGLAPRAGKGLTPR